jgi:prepilin-type N-terminal cleavage/methylation domain-containing protein
MQRKSQVGSQAGFTLVELAISLMVIGILIAGMLKGIELVQNAKVTQVVRQISENQTAQAAFISMYRQLPGDINNPADVLSDCTVSPCKDGGNDDGKLTTAGEQFNYWIHQAKAKLLTGIDGDATTPDTGTPVSAVGGHVFTLYKTATDLPAHPYRNSNYYGYFLADGVTPSIHSIDAVRIDAKIDDGQPYFGDVRAEPVAGNSCINTDDTYNETDDAELCQLYVRMRY